MAKKVIKTKRSLPTCSSCDKELSNFMLKRESGRAVWVYKCENEKCDHFDCAFDNFCHNYVQDECLFCDSRLIIESWSAGYRCLGCHNRDCNKEYWCDYYTPELFTPTNSHIWKVGKWKVEIIYTGGRKEPVTWITDGTIRFMVNGDVSNDITEDEIGIMQVFRNDK